MSDSDRKACSAKFLQWRRRRGKGPCALRRCTQARCWQCRWLARKMCGSISFCSRGLPYFPRYALDKTLFGDGVIYVVWCTLVEGLARAAIHLFDVLCGCTQVGPGRCQAIRASEERRPNRAQNESKTSQRAATIMAAIVYRLRPCGSSYRPHPRGAAPTSCASAGPHLLHNVQAAVFVENRPGVGNESGSRRFELARRAMAINVLMVPSTWR